MRGARWEVPDGRCPMGGLSRRVLVSGLRDSGSSRLGFLSLTISQGTLLSLDLQEND